MPMLAAGYATERNLTLTPLVADFRRLPIDAPERRDACLVSTADAAVVSWNDRAPALGRVLALIEAKGVPAHVFGAPAKQKARRVRGPEEPEPRRRGMLPD